MKPVIRYAILNEIQYMNSLLILQLEILSSVDTIQCGGSRSKRSHCRCQQTHILKGSTEAGRFLDESTMLISHILHHGLNRRTAHPSYHQDNRDTSLVVPAAHKTMGRQRPDSAGFITEEVQSHKNLMIMS